MNVELFGQRIRKMRKDLGLTQRKLSAILGLASPDTLTRLENGKATQISLSVLFGLIDIAMKGDVEVWWLLGCESNPDSRTFRQSANEKITMAIGELRVAQAIAEALLLELRVAR
ncbi:MAG: Helix-turn-helix domain protein [Planctomycetes bacterium ADurb.Bin126]|nr:MAG: Helix-turn-helix domain protein [Planctomycetes bacterium ADurb.Bin126]HOD79972.1 helix-turn-helix domain-containing protein [Phycisphaerae bacterium]HQL74029.1 helix-turn-helix domain-containing protein [Phycisphaerae bacterium]